MYSPKVMKLFKHPKNVGEIKNADGVGEAGNAVCGDILRLYIKVKNGKIVGAKFRTLGCVAAIATSSMVTELVKGRTLERALEMTREEVAQAVGGLPPLKVHCSVLAVDALAEAIYDYLKKNGKPISKELQTRHERIRREAEEVEERHKEYAELQRTAFKMLK